MWLTSGEFCDKYKITKITLKVWKDSNKIVSKKLSSKKFLYQDLEDDENRINVLYARVSNTKQKNDLDHQIQVLRDFMNSNGVITDLEFSEVASGMNENRSDFNKLVRLVTERKVKTVFVTYKDRLTRFGFDYFKTLFALFGTEIIVINNTNESNYQQELTEDLISIIHHFSMKMYSNRRKELNQLKKSLELNVEID